MNDKDALHSYLRVARESLAWKLEGLTEFEARLPRTPTGTSLLGLLKHVAFVQAGYLGPVFGRPMPDGAPLERADPHADLVATAEESLGSVLADFGRSCELADATIADLPLDAKGLVPWWPEDRRHVTLHTVLIHVIAEINRHAGQADILREGIDGAAGLRAESSNLPENYDWPAYVARVRAIADLFEPSLGTPEPHQG